LLSIQQSSIRKFEKNVPSFFIVLDIKMSLFDDSPASLKVWQAAVEAAQNL